MGEWGVGEVRGGGRPGDQTVPPDSLAARTVPWAGGTAANGGVRSSHTLSGPAGGTQGT